MRDLRHESLFTRPLTTYPTCRRSGHTPHRGSCPVPGLAVHRQAVSEATPPNRSVAINPIPGRPAKYGAALDAGLPAQLVAHADVTPEDYCQLWEQTHGQRVSTATMSRAIARLGWRPSRRAWKPSPCRMRRSVFGIADTQPALPWLADDTPCDLGLYASVPQLGRYLHQKTG